MCVYLNAKFQDSSIILTSFRQGFYTPYLKADPWEASPRLGLIYVFRFIFSQLKTTSFQKIMLAEKNNYSSNA